MKETNREAWDILDEAVDRLEDLWRQGVPPDLSALLPEGGPSSRKQTLATLIKIDQEYRWRSGERKLVEAYLEEWPELSADPDTVVELVEAECRIRAVLGQMPAVEELGTRFPHLSPQADLAAVVVEASREMGESGADTGDGGPTVVGSDTTGLTDGRRFGRYQIRRLLGGGGMGTVYLAFDTQLQREVALKTPRFDPTEEPAAFERFLREARAAAAIQHPNICPVYDVGEIDGIYFLTMRLIGGQSLADRMKAGPLKPEEAARQAAKLARALAAVHAEGIVHRDIKPSNVMLDPSGEPLLMDFGLARSPLAAGGPETSASAERPSTADIAQLTGAASLLGTPAYMSPEQAARKPADARSDIYSLGVIFYEMLTGRLPFRPGQSAHDPERLAGFLEQIIRGDPPKPRSVRPRIPSRLEAICLKAMAKDARDRYTTADEMADAIDRFLRASATKRARLRAILIGAAAAALALVAGVIVHLKTGEGVLELEVSEPGTKVSIDGDEVQIESTHGSIRLHVGDHELSVAKTGFADQVVPIAIRWRGQRVPVRVELQELVKEAAEPFIQGWLDSPPGIGGLDASSDGSLLTVASVVDKEAYLTAFDVSSGKVLKKKFLRRSASELDRSQGNFVQSPNGHYLYGTDYYDRHVSRYDLEDDLREERIAISLEHHPWPLGIARTPDGKKLVVASGQDGRPIDMANDRVTVIDVAEDKFAVLGQVALPDEIHFKKHGIACENDFAYALTFPRKSETCVLNEIRLAPPYEVTRQLSFPGDRLFCVVTYPPLQRLFVSDPRGRKIWVVDRQTFKPVGEILLEGHAPQTLTVNRQGNLMVALCADSRTLFFINPRDGAVVGKLEGLRRLAWYVAFSVDCRRLFVGHAAPEGGVAVINIESFFEPARVVFASDRAGGSFQIYRMDLDGTNVVRVTKSQATERSPRWSPDGTKIAFISDRSGQPKVCVTDPSGDDVAVLAHTDPKFIQMGTRLDWSPDGRSIAYIGKDLQSVHVVDSTSGEDRALIEGEFLAGYGDYFTLCWRETDGMILLDCAKPGWGYDRDIFLIDPADGTVSQLTDEKGKTPYNTHPAASPDGRHIAVSRVLRQGEGPSHLFLMRADGTGLVRLPVSAAGEKSCPRWAPGGKALVYAGQDGPFHHLYTVPLDAERPTQLTWGESNDVEPDVAPGPLIPRPPK